MTNVPKTKETPQIIYYIRDADRESHNIYRNRDGILEVWRMFWVLAPYKNWRKPHDRDYSEFSTEELIAKLANMKNPEEYHVTLLRELL